MLSFWVYFLNFSLSPTLFGRGKLHPYSPYNRFAARIYQKTKSQAFETRYYGHPVKPYT